MYIIGVDPGKTGAAVHLQDGRIIGVHPFNGDITQCRMIAANAGQEGSVVVQKLLSEKEAKIGYDAENNYIGDPVATWTLTGTLDQPGDIDSFFVFSLFFVFICACSSPM